MNTMTSSMPAAMPVLTPPPADAAVVSAPGMEPTTASAGAPAAKGTKRAAAAPKAKAEAAAPAPKVPKVAATAEPKKKSKATTSAAKSSDDDGAGAAVDVAGATPSPGADEGTSTSAVGGKEWLIVAKSVRALLKAMPNGMHCGADALPMLNTRVQELLTEAASRASGNGRKTLKGCDF